MQLKPKPSDADATVGAVPPRGTLAALEGGPRRLRWERLRWVLGHPAHLVTLALLVLVGVVSGSAWMLLPIAALEGLALAAPRLERVRRRADRHRRQRRRFIAARARCELVPYMEAAHGKELTELERRAAAARAQASAMGDGIEALVDDWYGLDRLLGTYVRLSIAHRAARESASLTDRDALCHEIRALEAQREHAASPRQRRLIERHLSVLRSRAACLERNEEEREALAVEIASVAALARLAHERTHTLTAPGDLHGEVERLVADAELHDQALGELDADDEFLEDASVTELRSGVRVLVDDEQEEALEAPEMLRAGGLG
jgi:hypothetical protein